MFYHVHIASLAINFTYSVVNKKMLTESEENRVLYLSSFLINVMRSQIAFLIHSLILKPLHFMCLVKEAKFFALYL
jgi:hypothetical protein